MPVTGSQSSVGVVSAMVAPLAGETNAGAGGDGIWTVCAVERRGGPFAIDASSDFFALYQAGV